MAAPWINNNTAKILAHKQVSFSGGMRGKEFSEAQTAVG
jgi:hypothetical protein